MDNLIEQALIGIPGKNAPLLQANSPGFLAPWKDRLIQICNDLGLPATPEDIGPILALLPFDKNNVALIRGKIDIQQADPGILFHCLVIPRVQYKQSAFDPFLVDRWFPPSWDDQQRFTSLSFPETIPFQERTVEDLRDLLKQPNSATLLGTIQALIDGGKVVFERSRPDPALVGSIWALLPYSTREELSFSTLAFANRGRNLDIAIVTPAQKPEDLEGYIPEASAGDYPEGRYELALQIAIENQDQAELVRLLYRRNRKQTLHIALWILSLFLIASMISGVLKAIQTNHSPPAASGKTSMEKPLVPIHFAFEKTC